MSSVQSFIRQIPLATTYYTCSANTPLYTFVAGTGNGIPGNYPNNVGYCSTTTSTFTSTGGSYLRDMGKTIKCPTYDGNSTYAGPFFFREVQVMFNAASQNSLPTFGVTGGPGSPSVQGYNTYYVPVAIGGSDIPSASVGFPLTPIAGGQM